MTPQKIKAYGFMSFTYKQYIITQSIGFTLLVIGFVLSFVYNYDDVLFGNAKVTILVITFLEVIETYFMLKKFHKLKK